jgi:hypothetical protein
VSTGRLQRSAKGRGANRPTSGWLISTSPHATRLRPVLDWEAIARAQSHPLRLAILEMMLTPPPDGDPGWSAKTLANAPGKSLARASHHMRELRDRGWLAEVGTRRARGGCGEVLHAKRRGSRLAVMRVDKRRHPGVERQWKLAGPDSGSVAKGSSTRASRAARSLLEPGLIREP